MSLIPENIRGTRPGTPRPQQQRNDAPRQAGGAYEISSPHAQNFIDCIRSREQTIAPIEAGAGTAVLCCLCNIAYELGRPVKWNPATRTFVGNDKEAAAHRLYYYEYRKPYVLPYLDKRC